MTTKSKYHPARYTDAVEWIANEDEPDETNVEKVAGYISTCLVADLFGKNRLDVARDVVGIRTGYTTLILSRARERRKRPGYNG